MMDNNPLKQYFRRPAIHIKLPSGTDYERDIIDFPATGELPVYPMTANDEITARTPDALFNGSAVVSIIQSCIPSIKNPWKLHNVDIETILIAIRIATNGEEMDVDTVCPNCKETMRYGIKLSKLLSEITISDYSQELPLGDLAIKFCHLTYQDNNNNSAEQFEIQRGLAQLDGLIDGDAKNKAASDLLKRMNVLTQKILARNIEYIRTPETTVTDQAFIHDFLQNCDKKIYNIIRDNSIKLRDESTSKPLRFTCIKCQHNYQQKVEFNITDFFV